MIKEDMTSKKQELGATVGNQNWDEDKNAKIII